MSTGAKSENRRRTKGELKTLIKYLVMTAVTTGLGLSVRYLLLHYCRGIHQLSLFGHSVSINVDDNLAYTAYYVSSVLVMYLWKWFDSEGKKAGSFIPRFLGYCALNAVSVVAGNLLLSVLLGWGVHGELAFWLTCPFTFLINYLGSRLVVFRDVDNLAAGKRPPEQEGAEPVGGKE